MVEMEQLARLKVTYWGDAGESMLFVLTIPTAEYLKPESWVWLENQAWKAVEEYGWGNRDYFDPYDHGFPPPFSYRVLTPERLQVGIRLG